jgi:hypothetical protein
MHTAAAENKLKSRDANHALAFSQTNLARFYGARWPRLAITKKPSLGHCHCYMILLPFFGDNVR